MILYKIEIEKRFNAIFIQAIIIMWIALITPMQIIFAQSKTQIIQTDNKSVREELDKLAFPAENTDWIKFRPESNIEPLRLFVDNKAAFGLTEKDEMQLVNQTTDEIGYTHYFFHQFYNGIRVEGSDYLLHSFNGFLQRGNGKLATNFKVALNFPIGEEAARNNALKEINAVKYSWNDQEAEQHIKQQKKDMNATYFPYGEQVLVSKSYGNRNPKDYVCAYKFEIFTSVPFGGWKIFVNAQTGEIIRKTSLIADVCNITASVTTSFYSSQTINTSFSSPNYRLRDNCTPTEITVYNQSSSIYTSSNNTWTGNEIRSAVTSLWGVRQTIDYYSSVHSRNGYDGIGGDISINQGHTFSDLNGNPYYSNATFLNGTLDVGWNQATASTPGDDWNSLDILGHEVTHGVTANNGHGGLDYINESGALNESFSDIMGKCVEFWATPSTFDWLVANKRGAIRSLLNPNSFTDEVNGTGTSTVMPDTYNGTGWYSGSNDYGGVHHNSSVQNFMFYLLVTGGSGTNDIGDAYSVTGIGMTEARLIAYYALTNNLTSSGSTFLDARKAWLQAAEFLYGSCSNEAIQVGNAWYAVNVGSQSPIYSPNICGSNLSSGYYAINNLQVSNGCTAIVPTNSFAYFYSGAEIHFYPGFSAQNGSLVHAYIDPCNISFYNRSGNSDINNDNEKNNFKENSEIKISPNPFTNRFTVEFAMLKDDDATIQLFDVMGNQIKTITKSFFKEGRQTIDVSTSDLSSGIYMLILQSSDGTQAKKIIKAD